MRKNRALRCYANTNLSLSAWMLAFPPGIYFCAFSQFLVTFYKLKAETWNLQIICLFPLTLWPSLPIFWGLRQNFKMAADVSVFGPGILKYVLKKLHLFLSYQRKIFSFLRVKRPKYCLPHSTSFLDIARSYRFKLPWQKTTLRV